MFFFFLEGGKYIDGDNRIIIFSSEKSLKFLKMLLKFSVMVLLNAAQVYSLHVNIGSTLEVTNIVPCMHVVLPNKNQNIYERYFFFPLEGKSTFVVIEITQN